MFTRSQNKPLVAGLALTIAGMLSGACMLIENYLPAGSAGTSFTALVLQGLAVAAAVVIFYLSCESIENSRGRNLAKLAGKISSNPRAVASARGPRLSGSSTFGNAPSLPKPMRARNQYPLSARGFAPSNDLGSSIEAKRAWHGQ